MCRDRLSPSVRHNPAPTRASASTHAHTAGMLSSFGAVGLVNIIGIILTCCGSVLQEHTHEHANAYVCPCPAIRPACRHAFFLLTLTTCYAVFFVAFCLLSGRYSVTSQGNGIAVLDTLSTLALHALCSHTPCSVLLRR
jgi:hypothetical protein